MSLFFSVLEFANLVSLSYKKRYWCNGSHLTHNGLLTFALSLFDMLGFSAMDAKLRNNIPVAV